MPVILITNRKSHTGFRLITTSMTLNDLERRNSPHFAFFPPNSIYFQADYITVVEDRPIMSIKYCIPVAVFHFWPKLQRTLQRGLSAIAEHLVNNNNGAHHICRCGALVGARGQHGLVYKQAASRIARHQQLNDLMTRALVSAGVPATKEPAGLTRRDGKHLDGMTQILWRSGKLLVWDVTIVSTLAVSYVDVERWSNSLLPGNARNMSTSLQHTFSFQLPWRP